jgi:hypothetical protein
LDIEGNNRLNSLEDSEDELMLLNTTNYPQAGTSGQKEGGDNIVVPKARREEEKEQDNGLGAVGGEAVNKSVLVTSGADQRRNGKNIGKAYLVSIVMLILGGW